MNPQEQDSPIQNMDTEQVSTPAAQPGVTYQPTPEEPKVTPLDPALQQQTPTVKPQQYSNPFAGQPFMNQTTPQQPVVSQNGMPPLTPTPDQPVNHIDPNTQKTKTTKRLLVVLGVLMGLFTILAALYIFLVYIPNKPQNVWNTGLNRTGLALARITSGVAESDSLDALKKLEITGVLTASAGDATYSGELNVKYDTANAVGDVVITQKNTGQADKTVTAKFATQFKEATELPTIYFQFAGLKSLGFSDFIPGLTNYEDKWISLDQAYVNSTGVTPSEIKEAKDKQITSQDLSEAMTVVANTTGDYIFTTNSKTAVIEQRRFVAKEKIDGKLAYHYIVGINKQHAKDYCAAVIDGMVNTQIYKKYTGDDEVKQKDSLTKGCQENIDEIIKDTDTFDMWIDARYKLIYKLRFTDEKDKNNYTDLGQIYNGGSNMTFFVTKHNGTTKTDTTFALEPNFKTHVSKATVLMANKDTSPYELKVVLEAKPYSGDIKAEVPTSAISIEEVFKQLNVTFNSKTPEGVNDTERRADIRAIGAQLDAYHTSNKRYPTLANLNDAKWLKANFSGLDVAALKDPENSSSALVPEPTKQRYAYQVSAKDGAACDNIKKDCTTYTLTATLSDGKLYVKQSLN